MTEDIKNKIENINDPSVQELIIKFQKRHEMNVVDVAEIIYNLIKTLKLDFEKGRQKQYSISVHHLGGVLGVSGGVISQYMSINTIPLESKNFLKNYDLSLINAYHVSRQKGKDEQETIKIQKDEILKYSNAPSFRGSLKRIDILIHATNQAKMIMNSIISSHKIPTNVLINSNDTEALESAITTKNNIEKCISFIAPKVARIPFLRMELDFCNAMLRHNEHRFCGYEISSDCLNKQIEFINNEIVTAELESKLPHISSLVMMKNELEKIIEKVK